MKNIFKNISFNRHELAGSFGDIGTDLPLILALVIAGHLDFASVFIMFGLLQILSGLIYKIPMPMQPLKAMAVIVIAQNVPGSMLFTAGFIIGIIMLLLSLSGSLLWLQRKIPHHVVRGLQIGLGLSLLKLSVFNYMQQEGLIGLWLIIISFFIYFFFKKNKKIPASLLIIIMGLCYTMIQHFNLIEVNLGFSLNFPKYFTPDFTVASQALILLVLPQLPLSLSNSVIATHKTLYDFYPERNISINKIGMTYSLVNLISPFFSGIPVCHGSGGLAGHYAFGARSGGSVIIYGSFYLVLGVFFTSSALNIMNLYPKSILGFILFIEALVLISLSKDLLQNKSQLIIAIIVGIIALLVPQGYLVGVIVGVLLSHLSRSSSN